MIHHINHPHDTANVLEDGPTGLVVFDLAPNVDPMKIAIACKECTDCETVSFFGLDDDDVEYCDIPGCKGYLDGSYAALVIQAEKVVFALSRRPR